MTMRHCLVPVFMFLAVSAFQLPAQSGPAEAGTTAPEAGAAEEAPKEDEQSRKAKENLEEARKALRFGIDSTVLGVIKQAREGKDVRLKDNILELRTASNPEVVMAVLDYFAALEEYDVLLPRIKEILRSYQEYSDKLVVRCMKFLVSAKVTADEEMRTLLLDIATLTSKERQNVAIETIGSLEYEGAVLVLRDLYKKSSTGLDQRKAIVTAIGNKKDLTQLPFLKGLFEDAGEDKEIRRAALAAVGQLADVSVLPIIRKALVSSDLFERTAAINALAGFSLGDVDKLYEQALRDPAWRNRVLAVTQLETRKEASFVDFFLYLAQSDPEKPVRQAAIKALVTLDRGWDTFNTWLADKNVSAELKMLVSAEACRNNADKIMTGLLAIVDQEWKLPASRLLEAVAKDMAAGKTGNPAFYARLLAHDKEALKLLAIRGIFVNRILLLKGNLEDLLTKNPGATIKGAIEDALKKW